MIRCSTVLVGFCLALSALNVYAVTPSEVEWESWSDLCRARFVVAGDGVGSKYENRIPNQNIAYWQSKMGSAWYALHHYCYGQLYASRASLNFDSVDRERLLTSAMSEFKFVHKRVEPEHPFFGEVASRLAYVYRDLGLMDEAIATANNLIARRADSPDGYLIKSILLRSAGDQSAAVAALERGLNMVGEESASLHYALALNLLDISKIDDAEYHARRAYELGYPLPGLKRRLNELGRQLE